MSVGPESVSVLVCRGCCCGTQDDIDHDGHLASIRIATEQIGGRLRVTGCIGPCDRKNVVVVRARMASGRWFARYFAGVDQSAVDILCDWFSTGDISGPEPAELAATRFTWPLPRATRDRGADDPAR